MQWELSFETEDIDAFMLGFRPISCDFYYTPQKKAHGDKELSVSMIRMVHIIEGGRKVCVKLSKD